MIIYDYFSEFIQNKLKNQTSANCTTPWIQYVLNDFTKEKPCTDNEMRSHYYNFSATLTSLIEKYGNKVEVLDTVN